MTESQVCPGQGHRGDHLGELQARGRHPQRRSLVLVFAVPDQSQSNTHHLCHKRALRGWGSPWGESKGEAAQREARMARRPCPAHASTPSHSWGRLRLCGWYKQTAGTRRLMGSIARCAALDLGTPDRDRRPAETRAEAGRSQEEERGQRPGFRGRRAEPVLWPGPLPPGAGSSTGPAVPCSA